MRIEIARFSMHIQGPRKDGSLAFGEVHSELNSYFCITKLKLYCSEINQSRIFGEKRKPSFRFLEVVERIARLSNHPLVLAYYFALKMLSNEKDAGDAPETLARILNESANDFELDEAIDLYGYLLNYCSRRIMNGNQNLAAVQTSAYLNALKSGILIRNGKVSPKHFKNIVSAFAFVGKFQMAQEFLEEYKDQIGGFEPKITLELATIILKLHQREFDGLDTRLLGIIHQATEDQFWGIEARKLLLKLYFERFDQLRRLEVEACNALIDSFRMLIERRKTLSDEHKAKYLNFVKILRSLWGILNTPNAKSEKYKLLIEKVIELENLASRQWLQAIISHYHVRCT